MSRFPWDATHRIALPTFEFEAARVARPIPPMRTNRRGPNPGSAAVNLLDIRYGRVLQGAPELLVRTHAGGATCSGYCGGLSWVWSLVGQRERSCAAGAMGRRWTLCLALRALWWAAGLCISWGFREKVA